MSFSTKINNNCCGKGKSHAESESLWGNLYYQGVMETVTKKYYISGKMFPEVLKSRPRREILQLYTILYPLYRM